MTNIGFMRRFLASSIGVTCAAALALPLAQPAAAHPAPDARPAPHAAAAPAVAGSTQSLALSALPYDRALGASPGQGLTRREVRPFSLAGVVWDDADRELRGRVELRARDARTGAWGGWRELETHNAEHAADQDTAEAQAPGVHGSTAPMWLGASDAVEARVTGESGAARALPEGLHLELVDPGDPAGQASPDADRTAAAKGTALPALDRTATEREAKAGAAEGYAPAKPRVGPRPRIITRKGWGADEKLRERQLGYTSTVKAAFVHHTATGNSYSCAQAPSVIRSIYRYHVKSSGWRDIGYNFLVDKCGNIYEGRAGGVTKPVMGAHTLGFNTNSTGIAVLGTYTKSNPPAAVSTALAKLTAWKLGLHGRNPKGKVALVSGGSNLYKKGRKVSMNVISGHRDGFATECPGTRLYKKLGTIRSKSAGLQGR